MITKKARTSPDLDMEEAHSILACNTRTPTNPELNSIFTGQLRGRALEISSMSSLLESDLVKKALGALYAESAVAKIWGVAQKALVNHSPPTLFPEYTKPGGSSYVYRKSDFWTSGFFPGSLYLLLERQRKHAQTLPPSPDPSCPKSPHPLQLQYACWWWTFNLHKNATISNTHDLSFMISPWARKAWDLNGDVKAYDTLITAARSLASRFSAKTQCIRSWDSCVTQRYAFLDPDVDFLVIIDNMLNLDLLFWAAAELHDTKLFNIAFAHARATQQHHIRADHSTVHVVNFDPATGFVKAKMTNQGYADTSCWSRGQAWAVLGFAQTYAWTHDTGFLITACKCADYFLEHLPSSGVPPWDFAAPFNADTPTDTSAAMIVCYGMLLIHEFLGGLGRQSFYLDGALHILTSVCAMKLTPAARFMHSATKMQSVEAGISTEAGPLEVDMGRGGGKETILGGATINNYEFAPRRWADHGLVYADYYFLLVGNKLLDMGLGQHIAARFARPDED